MTTPVNLNKVRKERARKSRRALADENAVKFGQTKAQKEVIKIRADQEVRKLDGHKKEP